MVLAQVAVALSLLLTALAVTVDLGFLLLERRHAQAAADAAALAAAGDIYTGSPGTAAGSATTVAQANYTGTTPTVTVNIPPSTGAFAGNTGGYVEVIVTWNQPRFFSAILGSGTIPVSARAVARGASVYGGSGSPAILMLGSGTNITDITANGSNASVTVTGTTGSIYLDSTTSPATLNGSGSTVSAPYVYAADSSLNPKVTTTVATAPYTSQPQLPDPLSYLPDPPSSSNAGSGVTVDSTTYAGGMSGTVTLNPSAPTIYIVGGSGIDKATLTEATNNTNGVMIYLSGTSAGVNLTGQSSVNLPYPLPSTAGTYAGMSFFQNRSDSTGWAVKGNGSLNVGGTIYAPAADIVAAGNGTAGIGSQIIASSMTMDGNGNTISYNATAGNHAATRVLRLVE